jgi:hypothetical protein
MTKAQQYAIDHAGWLLASLAPINIAAGERFLAELNPQHQIKAKDRARALVRLYLKHDKIRNGPVAYRDHAYFTKDAT